MYNVHWFGVQSYASWELLFNSIIPIHLSVNHPWWILPNWIQIVSVVGLLLVIPTIIIFKDKYPLITLGLGWYWIVILPRLFIYIPMGWIREQHIYPALAGVSISLGALLCHQKSSF